MSYQSKYTGQEIDQLLDRVNAGGGNVTTLWEGKAPIDTTVSLSDNVENYDFIILEAWFCSSSETPGTVRTETIRVANHLEGNGNNMNIFTSSGFGVNLGDYRNNATDHYASLRVWVRNSDIYVSTFYGSKIYAEVYLKSAVGIKFGSGASTPTGNIISFMGRRAPSGYLICDGTEFNIADYPKLANHFEEQFGSKNHFGGDGTTTFMVPDLRDEFLRGYHGENEGQLSGEIGEHQDATEHLNTYISDYGTDIYTPGYDNKNVTQKYSEADQEIKISDIGSDESKFSLSTGTAALSTSKNFSTIVSRYTSRPTNVAVLYCIKY